MQFPGYGGRMRCYQVSLLGSSLAGDEEDTELTFKTYGNFGAASQQTFTVTIATDGSGEDNSTGGSEILFKPRNQKLDSMRVTLELTGDKDERGWSPEGLIFEVGQRPVETRFKVDSDKTA